MNNLTMIPIEKLEPHPDNPRKNLGDLTELADSIKAVGIMQNLTVVPHEDKYRILIGHRRASAAKLAGLKELPCAIITIEPKDQIEIMLVENMQRSDLTVLEESWGLQMMIKLGNSVKAICEKTGFSESKVRHRVKMGELDQKVLQKKFEECQNISILDLQKLEQIKDQKRKDKVLKVIGTSNFEMALKKAVEEEKHDEWEREIFSLLPDDIERIDDSKDKTWLCSFRDWVNNNIALKTMGETSGKKYWKRGYSSIEIYIDTPEEVIKKRDRAKEKDRERTERKKAVGDVLKRMRQLREEFVQGLSNRDCGYLAFHDGRMQKYMIAVMEDGCGKEDKVLELMGVQIEEKPASWDGLAWSELLLKNITDTNFKTAVFIMMYLYQEPKYENICDWNGMYNANHNLKKVYEFMNLIGYKTSDEERQILDGTHELYVKEEE